MTLNQIAIKRSLTIEEKRERNRLYNKRWRERQRSLRALTTQSVDADHYEIVVLRARIETLEAMLHEKDKVNLSREISQNAREISANVRVSQTPEINDRSEQCKETGQDLSESHGISLEISQISHEISQISRQISQISHEISQILPETSREISQPESTKKIKSFPHTPFKNKKNNILRNINLTRAREGYGSEQHASAVVELKGFIEHSERFEKSLQSEPAKSTKRSRRSQNPDPKFDEVFADFWGKVPKKVSKLRARKAFEAVLSNGQATAEQLIEGVERYAQNIQTSGTEYQFIKHPATWLNDGGWEDETPKIITPLTFRSKGSPVYSKGRVLAEFYEETMEEIRREYRHAE